MYPTIFKDKTNINLLVDNKKEVKIEVYDISGRLIKTISDDIREQGEFGLIWDGTDNRNKSVASGYYIVIADLGNKRQKQKVLKIK